MKRPGQIAILRFPQTNHTNSKLRPALLLAPLPGKFDDWLTCMISTKLHQAIENFDEIIQASANDFRLSGLKIPSVIRTGRLAVVSNDILVGSLGEIAAERLQRIRKNISSWITQI